MKEFVCLTINLVRKDMKNIKRSNLIERETIARGPRANLEILLISLRVIRKPSKLGLIFLLLANKPNC